MLPRFWLQENHPHQTVCGTSTQAHDPGGRKIRMPRSIEISVALAVAMTLTTAALAGAATITFTNQAAFAGATSGITFTTVDFEGVAPDNSFIFEPTPPGVTLMGANFTIDHSTGNTGNLFVIGDNF